MIDEKVYNKENMFGGTSEEDLQKYSRGGEFIENMVTDNEVEFCKRWFHLAGFNELLDDANEFFANKMFGSQTFIQANNPYNNIISPVLPTNNKGIEEGIYFDNTYIVNGVYFTMPDSTKTLLEQVIVDEGNRASKVEEEVEENNE